MAAFAGDCTSEPCSERSPDSAAACGQLQDLDAIGEQRALGLQRWAELTDAGAAARLGDFVAGDDSGDSLLLPRYPEKRLRRALHELLRSHFPTVFGEHQDQGVLVQRTLPLKCVAVDLDNTIWPGVLLEATGAVSEDAWAVHRLLHTELLRLHAAGVLLVSVSRNDEQPVLDAWPPPELCGLQPEHFVCHRFGWDAKSRRLTTLADLIGLAHGAAIFVDDMPPERAEVEAVMPRLRVLGADLRLAACVLRHE